MCSEFLSLLQEWNCEDLHGESDAEYTISAACSRCERQCEHLRWSLFSGFSHWPRSTDRGIHQLAMTIDEHRIEEIISYYVSHLRPIQQQKYPTGSFVERRHIHLHLLDKLHETL